MIIEFFSLFHSPHDFEGVLSSIIGILGYDRHVAIDDQRIPPK